MLTYFVRFQVYLKNLFQILIIISTVQITTFSISAPPLSFYDYAPNLVQGGKVTFVKGSVVDNDATATFNSTYTVSLQRMKNLNANSYFVVIGFKHISIDIPTYPLSILGYMILVQNMTSTNFGCLAWASYDPFITKYQVTYMAISRGIGNVYFFNQMCIVNQDILYPAFLDFTFTDTSIKQTGNPYLAVHSIYQFVLATSVTTTNALVAYAFPNSTNTYTVRLYSFGFFISTIGIQGIIFDTTMLNDVKRKHIFLHYQYIGNTVVGYFQGYIYSYPGVIITPNNVFFGLYLFYSASNKFSYDLNLVSSQVKLIKYATTPYVFFHILVYLRNLCPDPFTYVESKTECIPCMDNCLKCDGNECFQCAQNLTLSTDTTSCQCNKQLVSGICYEFESSPMKGCTYAEMRTSGIQCKMCSGQSKLILIQNQCKCLNGYEFDSNKNCVQVCGDGLIFDAQCDDGNTLNGDGCSDSCRFQAGFECEQVKSTLCKFKQELKFKPLSILKNRNNSVIIKFGTGKDLLFNIKFDHLIDKDGKKMFNLSMVKNKSNIHLETYLMSVQNNEITFLINYDFTIECAESTLNLDLSNTKYTPESSSAQFSMCGDNEPLEISEHWETFLKTEYVYNAFGILILVLLFVGLCTPKFIGLQAILTLQLIFYSCFLIKDVSRIPVGFKTFTSFKFSTGFNDLFAFTSIFLNDTFEKKVVWMGLNKTVVQNYNISFGMLIFSMFLMIGSIVYKSRKEKEFDGRFISQKKGELSQMQLGLSFAQKINDTLYNLMSHISYWSILQVIAAVSIQVLINNKNVHVSQINQFFKIGSLMVVVAIMLIFSVGLNNFRNIFLSGGTWGKLAIQRHVLTYKRIKLMYLLVMGMIMIPFNKVIFFEQIPISVLALMIHVIYMIILTQVQPYKTSLNVHKYGLFICQFTLLIFLIVVNFANFFKIDESYSLSLVYLIVAVCVIIVIFTVIRLYYKYKYGQQLQNKIQKQRQIQNLKQITKEENQIKRKLKKIEDKIQQKLNQHQKQRLQNKFLIQNQIRQDLMKEEIEFIEKRPNITQERKEILYFEKFEAKPLSWLLKNNIEEYNRVNSELQQKNAKEGVKKSRKLADPEYVKLTNKLRKQFHKLNRLS